jgi:glutamate racemase
VNASSDNRPIGLFDSGIGGISILRPLMESLSHESFLYLGDTARLPYGSKSPATIERYLRQNISFLNGLGVKAIVVACNSASTALLGKNHDFLVPVYNVIEPGARAALAASSSKKIGVLGTKATVSAQAYVKALEALYPGVEVFQQACPLLVPLVEEGWEADPLAEQIVARYLEPLLAGGERGIDTLVLGCTHYPALRSVIGRVAGGGVKLVDGAGAVLEQLREDMKAGKLHPSPARTLPLEIMTTDISPGFLEVAQRLMGAQKIHTLKAVDIS